MKKEVKNKKELFLINLGIFLLITSSFIIFSKYIPKITGAITGVSSNISSSWILIGLLMFFLGFLFLNISYRPTTRAPWLNEDGTPIKELAWKPINKEEQFGLNSFIQNYEKVELLKKAEKAEYSKEILGNDRLESISDSEFNKIKGGFNREFVQEDLYNYLIGKRENIANMSLIYDPKEVERFMLNKNPDAKFSAYKLQLPEDEKDPRFKKIQEYNAVVDRNLFYHAEKAVREQVGDDFYAFSKLGNLLNDPYRLAFVQIATSGRVGDNSRIAQGITDYYGAQFLESARKFGGQSGVLKYLEGNIKAARELEGPHKASLKNLEAEVEEIIKKLGPGASEQERANVYRLAEKEKEKFSEKYQNAGLDAGYIFKGLGSMGYKTATKLYQTQRFQEALSASYEANQRKKAA